MKKNTRKGILAGGNWIIDFIKMIDVYPNENALANIFHQNTSNGGAPFNVLKALHKMNFSFPLEGVGVIGNDENGEDILKHCKEMEINTGQVKVLDGISTSYTDVMTVCNSGKRTFFHYRGANAMLDEVDFNFSNSQAKIFHLGYLLLLDKLDKIGPDGLSGAAKVFEKAKEAGFITSADIVSEQSERYFEIISPSIPFIDILFINEFEAKMLTELEVYNEEGEVLISNVFEAAEAILYMGVLNWVIIHFPKGAIALNRSGQRIFQPSVNMPPEKVKGTVGAGDAFAAGVLAGIHEKWSMKRSLELGACVAAISLQDITASGGIQSWQACMKFGENLGYNNDILMNE